MYFLVDGRMFSCTSDNFPNLPAIRFVKCAILEYPVKNNTLSVDCLI